MSLVSRRPTNRRVSRSAMNGWVEDFELAMQRLLNKGKTVEEVETINCKDAADNATASMQVYRLDLAKNWHPTGYYSSDQVKQLVGQAQTVLAKASDAVETASRNQPDRDYDGQEYGGQEALSIKRAEIQKQFTKGLEYIEEIRKANASGIDLIDSPGLRDYVMSCMRTAENSTWAASFTQCITPWWAGILSAVVSALNTLWTVAKAIAGFVYKVGEIVYHIPDFAATFMTYLKWAVILGGGYYLAVRADVVPDTFHLKDI